jgi:tetratricopeptide (TPR) repeat protein
MVLTVVGSLLFSNTIFAATQDELTLMMYDARGAIGLGKYEDAMGFCDQALKSGPNFAEAYAVRSQAKFSLKNIDGALEDANKAIELEPEEYIDPAYYVRALIALEHAADPAQALEFIEKAIDIVEFEPVPEYFELRADIYKKMGKQDLADADLLKAKEIRSK